MAVTSPKGGNRIYATTGYGGTAYGGYGRTWRGNRFLGGGAAEVVAAGVDLGLSYDSPSAYYEYPDNAYGYNYGVGFGSDALYAYAPRYGVRYRPAPLYDYAPGYSVDAKRHLCTTLRPVTSRQSAMLAAKAAVAAHEPARAALVSRRHVAQPVRTLSSPVPLLVTGPPLTRGHPTERRFAGCRFLDPRDVLDPSGSADPGRGEVEESVPVTRISRRLGPGQALTRVGAVLLRGHGHADHPSTGRLHA